MKTIKHLSQLVQQGSTDWTALGNIYTRELDDLVLFNYSSAANFGEWNNYERVCRGLIINHAGEIVARPFDKFFNWLGRGQKASGHIVTVTEKVDGSLGILFRHGGKYKIATRGSFDGEQAIRATELLQQHTLVGLDNSLTLLFEIVYPENKIVVDYGDREELVLLAARNRFTGRYLPFFPDVYELAQKYDFALPKVFAFNSVSDILAATGDIDENQEGWVAEFSDGSRWKFKGDRYLELHKMILGLSRSRVVDLLRAGIFEDYLSRLPADAARQAEEWAVEVLDEWRSLYRKAVELYRQAPKASRKEFALWTQQFYAYQPVLFAMFDNKQTDEYIWKLFKNS